MHCIASWTLMSESPEKHVKLQVLTLEIQGGTWNSAFLTSSYMILRLMVPIL